MVKVILFFFTLILFSTIANAQSIPKDLNTFDERILNKYILQEVNVLRKKARVDTLVNDDALLPAAENHAEYLVSTDELSHFQKSKVMKTPKNRVDHFGGQFAEVGENLQFFEPKYEVKIGREKTAEVLGDYERMAKYMVQQWKNSKPHYENIIRPDFKCTYSTFKVDEKTGVLYACQLFGGDSYGKKATEIEDFELKPENDKKCKNCDKPLGKDFFEIVRSGDSIYFISDRKKHVKKVLRNPFTDGLAFDVVTKSQFACDYPNKINGLKAVTGEMQAPVYRKSFYKKGNVFRRKYVQILLGTIPQEYRDSLIEYNLIVLKKKRTCTNYVQYDILLKADINLELDYELDTLTRLITREKKDTINKRIYFDKSNAKASLDDLQQLNDTLTKFESTIQKAKIEGFSSVEGSFETNKQLYQKRAENIMSLLSNFVTDSSKIDILTEENWELFKTDIKNTEFEPLAKLSLEKLKDTIQSSDLSARLEPILKNHRYADLTLYTSYQEKVNITPEKLNELYAQYLKDEDLKQLKSLQVNHFNLVQSGAMFPSSLTDVDFPISNKYSELRVNAAVLRYNVDSIQKYLYEELIQIWLTDENNKLVNTNLKIIEFHMNLSNGSFKDLVKGYNDLKSFGNMDRIAKSKLLLQMGMFIDAIEIQNRAKRRTNCAPYLKKIVKKAKLSNEEIFQVARYYYYVGDREFAYDLTRKIIDESNAVEDYVFFLKLLILYEDEIDRRKYIKYFLKVQEMDPENFCKYFIPPTDKNEQTSDTYLNFQILEDKKIKQIYCDHCY